MELKNFFVQDDAGNVVPNATCYLYQRGTENLAAGLVAANGERLNNPFNSGTNGLVQFAAPNGLYDVRAVTEKRDYRLRIQFNDVSETVAVASAAASRAEQARDVVQLWSGIFPNTVEGLKNTPLDGYFSVPSPESHEFLILYRNAAGAAEETKRYPSSQAVNKALVGAIRSYPTLALMQADITQEDGSSGVVTNDPNKALNGWYAFQKADAIWNRSDDQPASENRVSEIKSRSPHASGHAAEAISRPCCWASGRKCCLSALPGKFRAPSKRCLLVD